MYSLGEPKDQIIRVRGVSAERLIFAMCACIWGCAGEDKLWRASLRRLPEWVAVVIESSR